MKNIFFGFILKFALAAVKSESSSFILSLRECVLLMKFQRNIRNLNRK